MGSQALLGNDSGLHQGGSLNGSLNGPAFNCFWNIWKVDIEFDVRSTAEWGADGRDGDHEGVIGILAFDPLASLHRNTVAALDRVGRPTPLGSELTQVMGILEVDTLGLGIVAAAEEPKSRPIG